MEPFRSRLFQCVRGYTLVLNFDFCIIPIVPSGLTECQLSAIVKQRFYSTKGGVLKKSGLLLIVLFLILAPTSALAAFDATKIIDDEAFTNSGSMTTAQIQSFFDQRKMVLATFSEGGRSAAQIINDAAQTNGLNPQVILATLQKEQGLLTTGTGYDSAADPSGKFKTAMGYACPDSGGCDPKYAGFTKQVEGAAFQLRNNYNGATTKKFTDYQVGQTMTFDGVATFLANRATAALYRYTPHSSGNKSFYNSYFTYFLQYSSKAGTQNAYPYLAPGDSYRFSIKFQNIGNKSWDRGIVFLGTDRPRDHIPPFLLENRLNGDDTMWTTANRVSLK